jgi:hypothetical protein
VIAYNFIVKINSSLRQSYKNKRVLHPIKTKVNKPSALIYLENIHS